MDGLLVPPIALDGAETGAAVRQVGNALLLVGDEPVHLIDVAPADSEKVGFGLGRGTRKEASETVPDAVESATDRTHVSYFPPVRFNRQGVAAERPELSRCPKGGRLQRVVRPRAARTDSGQGQLYI
jgi:hypothetical protein